MAGSRPVSLLCLRKASAAWKAAYASGLLVPARRAYHSARSGECPIALRQHALLSAQGTTLRSHQRGCAWYAGHETTRGTTLAARHAGPLTTGHLKWRGRDLRQGIRAPHSAGPASLHPRKVRNQEQIAVIRLCPRELARDRVNQAHQDRLNLHVCRRRPAQQRHKALDRQRVHIVCDAVSFPESTTGDQTACCARSCQHFAARPASEWCSCSDPLSTEERNCSKARQRTTGSSERNSQTLRMYRSLVRVHRATVPDAIGHPLIRPVALR